MTIAKSSYVNNSSVSSSSRLVGKIKPLSVFGLIAQSSHFVLKSISGLQKSFFASSSSKGFKESLKPLAIAQPTSSETTRICGPLELRGIELIMKFGSIVRTIDELKSIRNQPVLEPVNSLSTRSNLNATKALPTSKVVTASSSKSCMLSEILEASKVEHQFYFTTIPICDSYYFSIFSSRSLP